MAFIGEIRIFPYNFVPRDWIECAGQTLRAQTYSALFAVIGTTYGAGPDPMSFKLPDLRNALPMHPGTDAASGRSFALGQSYGQPMVQLNANQIPPHSHGLQRKGAAGVAQKTNSVGPKADLGQLTVFYDMGAGLSELVPSYSSIAPDSHLDQRTITPTGGDGPHENRQPFVLLCHAICTNGDFVGP